MEVLEALSEITAFLVKKAKKGFAAMDFAGIWKNRHV